MDPYEFHRVVKQTDSPIIIPVSLNSETHWLTVEKLSATTGTVALKRKAMSSVGTARAVKDEDGNATVINVSDGADLEISGRAECFVLELTSLDGSIDISMCGQ